ncbi:E3 ubiquitin-protein ligase TRIM31 [Termitomyces sp. T112]|nr:E3 ubiquitin-protein ligase TRIM31 [Termitomyces sp. T112]KAH0582847.1 hypothetical protein H2248_010752 [Termitomyces sp. 'cryptogamus']
MPKTPVGPTTTRKTRRSSRLNKNQDTPFRPPETDSAPSRLKKRKPVASERTLSCTDELESVVKPQPSSSDIRRSHRITPAELIKREKILLKNEIDHKRRALELDERALQVMKKEAEVSLMLSQITQREAAASLAQLEEHFTCALCCEILAHPYTLNPGQCGHTFCALCILKWFFSRLHFHCGSWHESVDCPMCRSLLVITPDRTPRSHATFPFVPNRTVAAVCESLIEKLRWAPSSTLVVKREDSEGAWGLGWASCSRKKEASKEADEKVDDNADISSWREGGFTRTEWLKRDGEGKQEMNRIARDWAKLNCQDFRELKQKLGV